MECRRPSISTGRVPPKMEEAPIQAHKLLIPNMRAQSNQTKIIITLEILIESRKMSLLGRIRVRILL